jgi:hypothetical protein
MDIQLRNNQNLQNIRIVLLDENRMPRSCTVCGFFFVATDIKKKGASNDNALLATFYNGHLISYEN